MQHGHMPGFLWIVCLIGPCVERGNQLHFGVNRAKRPNITQLRIVIWPNMGFFPPDESAQLIELEMPEGQIAHLAVKERLATLPERTPKRRLYRDERP